MAAKIGDVVFKTGEAINMEEFWDDSALIKAYEKAVNSFKYGTGDESGKINQSHNGKKKKRRRKRSNKRETKSSCDEVDDETTNWSVGDKCLAVYSEDGLIYDAEIIEICSDIANMCVVRYSEYGNEEQQYLTDLMPATLEEKNSSYSHQNGECSDAGSANTGETSNIKWKVSDLCVAPEPPYQHYHEAVINSFSSSLTCKVTFIRSRKSHEVNVQDLQRSCDFNQSTSNHQPCNSIPPMPPFSRAAFTGIPRPPVPPPPPPVSLDDVQGDDESLASMLMSWYLSGYHTGYFKAVQQFKRNHSPNYTSESTNQPACQSNANPRSPGTNMDTKE